MQGSKGNRLFFQTAFLTGLLASGCGAKSTASDIALDATTSDSDGQQAENGFQADLEEGETDIRKDAAFTDRGPVPDVSEETVSDTAPDNARHLCSTDRASDPSLAFDCGTRGLDSSAPPSSWLRVLLKGFLPAEDGSPRVRIGLFWFNGFTVMPRDGAGLPDPTRRLCASAVPELLPTGIAYYDLDLAVRASQFIGMAVLHPLDADRLDSVILGNMTEILNRSPDVFLSGEESPVPGALFAGRYVRVGERVLRFELVGGDTPSIDTGEYSSLPGLYEFQYDISIPKRQVLAFKVYRILGQEGTSPPYFRLEYEGDIPISVDLPLISSEQQAISGCGCARDGTTPVEVPAGATCGPKIEGDFWSCYQTLASHGVGCCAAPDGLYGLPWEHEELVLHASCSQLTQFQALTAKSIEMVGDYKDLADLQARGLPESFQIGFNGNPGMSGTTMLATLCGNGEQPPYEQCAFYLSTLFNGARATLSNVERKAGAPATVHGLLTYDDADLPAAVTAQPCSRTWEFNLPVWNGTPD